jgi:hypothetical protein
MATRALARSLKAARKANDALAVKHLEEVKDGPCQIM